MAIVTPDGRYIVVRNRLWRASNPSLTNADRERHTRLLMSARRAVKAALHAQDDTAEKRARRRVQKAKTALGERGPVWWSDGAPDENRRMVENTAYREWWQAITSIRAMILTLLDLRNADASICPSEVARAVNPSGWRKLMPDVRAVARELARDGVIAVTQKGQRLSLDDEWRGPVRLMAPRGCSDTARNGTMP